MESVNLPPLVAPGPRATYSIPVWTEWEYLIHEAPLADVYEALQRRGADCWELVSTLEVNEGMLYLIFKRPKEEEED